MRALEAKKKKEKKENRITRPLSSRMQRERRRDNAITRGLLPVEGKEEEKRDKETKRERG